MKYECATHRYRGDYLPCPWPEHGTPPEVPAGVLVFRREMVRVGDHRSIGGCCTVYRWMSEDELTTKETWKQVPAWRVS